MPAPTTLHRLFEKHPDKARQRLADAIARGGTAEDIAARVGLSRRALFRMFRQLEQRLGLKPYEINLGPRGVKPSKNSGKKASKAAVKRHSAARELSPDPSSGDRS